MNKKTSAFFLFLAFLLSLVITSCSHNGKASKNTNVTFNIDRQTVNTILKGAHPDLLANKSFRAADDEESGTEPLQNEDEGEEEFEDEEIEDNSEVENAPYDAIYIDVSILGDDQQTKTALVKENEGVSIIFRHVPIEAVVWAVADIYTYTDETKTSKQVIYRGKSQSIIVRSFGNKLSILLEEAKLTVTFESNGGSAVESQEVVTGEKLTKPENPSYFDSKTKSVYAFMGWYTDPEFSKFFDFDTPVTQDLTLYAKWLSDYVLVPQGEVLNYLKAGRDALIVPELYVCQHEVTQAEYFDVTGKDPSLRDRGSTKVEDSKYPVENVSWYDAIVYCNLLSIKEGLEPCYKIKDSVNPEDWGSVPASSNDDWNLVSVNLYSGGYRLLTEAEWEYVATKGMESTTKDYDALVLHSGNSKNNTQSVTNRLVDGLGICNILGNVSEWCFDWYSTSLETSTALSGPEYGTARVKRGGDYSGTQSQCSPDARAYSSPSSKDGKTGFRVARVVNAGVAPVDTPVLYTITYQIEDCDEAKLTPVEFYRTDKVELPASLERTGYTFGGWYKTSSFEDDSKITGWDRYEQNGDITLYGKWIPITYTIKFNKGKSSSTVQMPDQVFTYDEPQELSECIFDAPEGLKFGGWINLDTTGHDDDDLKRDYSDKQKVVNLTSEGGAVITLYALWVNKSRGNIIYMIDGAEVTGMSPSSYLPSQAVTLPTATTDTTNLVRTGYTFSGWFTDPEYNSASAITGWTGGSKEGDITLYGKFEAIPYSITYDGLGTDWNWASGYNTYPSSYTVEDAVSLPASGKVNKDYYHLYGWYFDSALTQPATGGWDAGKTGDVTLYGMWDLNEYVINYELNDQLYAGSKSASQANNDGNTTGNFTIESSPITFANPTRPGYTFKGWYSDSSFAAGTEITSITPGTGSTQAHADYTLYAKWAINTNHIYFKEKDGSLMTYPSETQFTVEDDYMDLLDEPTKTGYDFGGWYLDSDYSGTAVIRIIPGTGSGQYYGDVDVYAKWNLIEYTINYVVNGGTAIEAGTCSVEESFPLPAASRAGYYFNGWCLDKKLTDTPCQAGITMDTSRALSFDGSDGSYDRQITLYAKWSSAGVDVTVTDPAEKITLTRSAPDSDGDITFTATTDLSANFTWYVDGVKDTSVTGNTFKFNKINHPKGLYTITVECGGYSITQTVIAAIGSKLSPTDVLDIVFTDGSAIAYESGLTLTNDQKAAVVAIIFYKGTECSNDSRTRMLGLGIKNSGTTQYEWALQNKKCYTQKLTDIVISKDESAPTDETPYCEYTSTSGTTSYLAGDMDGSDNLQIIYNIATSAGETSSLAENYPIFNYANTYASTANLTGSDYSSGWYIPSLIELYQVHKKWSQLNSILSLVGGDDLGENRYYWSSSQYVNGNNAEYDYWSWSLVIKGGEIYGNNKDATRAALCIREF